MGNRRCCCLSLAADADSTVQGFEASQAYHMYRVRYLNEIESAAG